MEIKAPFLSYDKLRAHADAFLAQYHPERSLPVPIEWIIESQFGIDIIPTPGLKANYEVDACISKDFGEIWVDEQVYQRYEARYRFSLTHELAHKLIHGQIFAEFEYKTIAEWKRTVSEIPEDQRQWLETQAYDLAGLILVPADRLREEFDRAAGAAWKFGIDLRSHADGSEARNTVESSLGRLFHVSRQVIRKRMIKDRLWESPRS